MKTCFKCLQSLPLDAFYKHSAMGDGHLGKCKECTKSDVKNHRAENLERIRAYDKLRASVPHRIAARKEYAKTDAGKAAHKKALHVSKFRFPERAKARNAVSNATRDGRLEKLPCFVCGERAEAHHPDYSRPLDVVWLCVHHHKQAHAIATNHPAATQAAPMEI